jgi:hypothetical protein
LLLAVGWKEITVTMKAAGWGFERNNCESEVELLLAGRLTEMTLKVRLKKALGSLILYSLNIRLLYPNLPREHSSLYNISL